MPLLPLILMALAAPSQPASDVYAPLRSYAGKWQVSIAGKPAGSKPDLLVNECAVLGKDFTCGQTVNGESVGLVVFIAKGGPDHYVTQTILPDGRASGLVTLELNGNTWTYSSRRDEYGKTTFYRTLNFFTGKNKIHFESQHSSDQKNWSVDTAGDEVKIG